MHMGCIKIVELGQHLVHIDSTEALFVRVVFPKN